MVLLKCKCLNITLHLSKQPVPVEVKENIGWADAESGSLLVGLGNLGVGGVSVEQPALVTELRSGKWKVIYCDNCNMAVYAQSDTNLTEILVNSSCLNQEQATELAKSGLISPVYHILLVGSDSAQAAHTHPELGACAECRRSIDTVRAQAAEFLEKERAAMEARCEEYCRQQREQFDLLRERMHADANFLAQKIALVSASKKGGKGRDTEKRSPQLAPQSRSPSLAPSPLPESTIQHKPLHAAVTISNVGSPLLAEQQKRKPANSSSSPLAVAQTRPEEKTAKSGLLHSKPSVRKPLSQAESVFAFDDDDMADDPLPATDDDLEHPPPAMQRTSSLKHSLESMDNLAAIAEETESDDSDDDDLKMDSVSALARSLPQYVPMRAAWRDSELSSEDEGLPPHEATSLTDPDFMLSQSVPEKQRRADFGRTLV